MPSKPGSTAVLAGLVLALAAALLPGTARAQQFDPAQVEAGMRIYKPNVGDCEQCHAWNGAGRSHDTMYSHIVAGGPSLVASTMTRAQMIEIVSCGTIHWWGVMPQYRNDAWTPQLRCYGKTRAEQPSDERPLLGPTQLTPAQIEAVVTYVQVVYQGKRMTLDYCRQYFGPNSQACDLLK